MWIKAARQFPLIMGMYLTIIFVISLLVLPSRFRFWAAFALGIGLVWVYSWDSLDRQRPYLSALVLAGSLALGFMLLLYGSIIWLALWLAFTLGLGIIYIESRPDWMAWVNLHKRWLTLLAALPPLGALIYIWQYLVNDPPLEKAQTALNYMGILCVLSLPLLWLKPPTLFRQFESLPPQVYKVRWWALGLGAGLLWLWAESNAYLFGYEWQFYPSIEFALMLSGLGLILWAFWDGNFQANQLKKFLQSREAVLVLILLIVASGVRLWDLENAIHSFVDEIHFANGVNQFSQTKDIDTRLLMPFQSVTAFPRLYPFLQYLTVELFGPSLSSLRLISVIFGVLTVIAVYFLGRELGDWQTGFLAGMICATFPPHVFFSRLALNNIADPLFGVLTCFFLLRGLKSNRMFDFALAGMALGLTQYFYEGGKLLYPPLVVLWMIFLAAFHRRIWRGSLVMGITALLTLFPLYYALTGAEKELTPRLDTQLISYDAWQERFDSGNYEGHWLFLYPFMLYTSEPDMGWFYGGNTALILPALVPFALIGLVVTILSWRTPAGLLLPMWIIATSTSNSFLLDSAWVPRFVVVFPALALFMGIGIRYISDWLPKHWALIGAVVLTVLCVHQTDYFFNRHLSDRITNLEFVDIYDVLFRVRNLPPETEVHVIDENVFWDYNIYTFTDFFDMPQVVHTHYAPTVSSNWLIRLDDDRPYAFFVNANDIKSIELIQSYYWHIPPQLSPYNIPLENQLILLFSPPNSRLKP